MKQYRDTESGEVFTAAQLEAEFNLHRDDIEASAGPMTFSQWLNNCTDLDGFLEEVTP